MEAGSGEEVVRRRQHQGTSVAGRFWIAASTREAAFAAYTPFILSLAAGNLRLDVFSHYIAQGAHFLHAFACAFEMAEDCADDDDDRATIADLGKPILQELNLHASVLKQKRVNRKLLEEGYEEHYKGDTKISMLYQITSGDLKLTKDEDTLLKEMQIQNSTAQDDTRVDGTTCIVLFIEEQMKQSEWCTDEVLGLFGLSRENIRALVATAGNVHAA